jgi:hypothetical protein
VDRAVVQRERQVAAVEMAQVAEVEIGRGYIAH